MKIIGIGLPEKYVSDFLEDQETRNYTIEDLLKDQVIIDGQGEKLGYEILGCEFGSFHSYLCNSLEKDYDKYFTFALNENGFIDSLADAEQYARYTNEDHVGAEPVLWLPWAIFEYKY